MSARDDAMWADVAREVDDEAARNAGLWARCFSESGGDQNKARARYMSERVQQLGGQAAPEAQRGGGGLRWLFWVVGILALVFVVMVAIGSRMPDDGRYDAQAVIEQCRKEQKNPALTEAAKRFAAGACNKLTDDYRAKYGRNP